MKLSHLLNSWLCAGQTTVVVKVYPLAVAIVKNPQTAVCNNSSACGLVTTLVLYFATKAGRKDRTTNCKHA